MNAPILPITELANNNLSAAFSLVNIKVHLDVRLNQVVSDINRWTSFTYDFDKIAMS